MEYPARLNKKRMCIRVTEQDLKKARNIGIVAHIDAGKTTTTETILYHTGRTHRQGTVDTGTATMDWMVQEQERGITITSAATYCTWDNHSINIIDTPGHVDFTVEVERSMRVLDGLVVVFCAVGGVQPQTETVWRQASKYKIPRLVFVNKMDRQGADFFRCVNQLETRFHARSIPVNIPWFNGDTFAGVIDLINMQLIVPAPDSDEHRKWLPIPDAVLEDAKKHRTHLLECLADISDTVAELFLDEQEIPVAMIYDTLRKATIDNSLIPAFCGTSAKDIGVQALLDAVVAYLPSPMDVPPVMGLDTITGEQSSRASEDGAPFSALAFKIAREPHVGHITYLRVYSGTISKNSKVLNASTGKRDRITRILRMHANRREELDELGAGCIGAVVGLKTVGTGDTLSSESAPIVLENITFPEPVISVAVEPAQRGDYEKMSAALHVLAKEDPTFRSEINPELEQTIISGMGELHLEIIIDRLMREFGVDATVGAPKVAFKETIKKTAEAEGNYVKQTGGSGHFGRVILRVEPLTPGEGFIFETAVKGGEVPSEYFPSVKKGVEQTLKTGVHDFPIIDIRVTLLGGAFHEVDSNDQAFQIAASMGFKEALRKGGCILKEPVMKVEIDVPDDYVGAVMQDMSARRGRLGDMETLPGNGRLLRATVPLSEMFGYATVLRNSTQGRGNFSMEFHSYEPVPASVTEAMVKKGA